MPAEKRHSFSGCYIAKKVLLSTYNVMKKVYEEGDSWNEVYV